MCGAVALNGGGVVLTGYSEGDWNGTNSGGQDFVALELDPDGTVLWRWQVILLPPFAVYPEYPTSRATIRQPTSNAKHLSDSTHKHRRLQHSYLERIKFPSTLNNSKNVCLMW